MRDSSCLAPFDSGRCEPAVCCTRAWGRWSSVRALCDGRNIAVVSVEHEVMPGRENVRWDVHSARMALVKNAP